MNDEQWVRTFGTARGDGQEVEERGPLKALRGRDGEREKLGKGGN